MSAIVAASATVAERTSMMSPRAYSIFARRQGRPGNVTIVGVKRWLRLLVCGFEGLIVLGVVYFEPTCCVRGTLWGEAFFEGRPTTYWRSELEHWEVYSQQLYICSLVEDPLRQPVRQPVRYVIYARQKSLLEV